MLRLITGLIAGGIWLLVLFLHSSIILYALVSITTFLALREYYAISLLDDEKSFAFLSIVTSFIPLLFAYNVNISSIMAGIILSFVLQALLIIIKYQRLKNPFILGTKISFGTLYIGLGASHIFFLSTLVDGWFWLLLLSIIITASDSGAFYVGSAFGRTKLCPSVSPGKTLEGLFGGMFFAALGAAITTFFLRPEINLTKIIILAVCLAGLGVIGDLTESILKRSFNVKDSGSILPGHGGILDRVDSFLMTAPALYYTIYFL